MGVQIDAVAIFLGGDGTDSDSLNIYERDSVSRKEELSRDKVVEWQEVVAKPPSSAIPNLSDLESRENQCCQMRPHALHPGAIQGKEGIKFCSVA